ncbi:MAG TPA: cytochrome c oxidase subunit II [Longimicrobiaceae bacterium]|nr:cytochrome c oxidase subunit II [Longimicrobiaceae bacterium]
MMALAALLQAPAGLAGTESADSISALSPIGEVGGALNQIFRRVLFLPDQASTVAPHVDQLHYFELGIMSLIALALGAAGVWWAVRYRERVRGELTRRVIAPLWLEVIGATSLLALFLFWWLLGYRQFLYTKQAPAGALEVYVMAKQWMWKFAYPNGRSSMGVLYVPAGEPVRLLLTSRDVIHSFYVPTFRVKQDAVPGRYTSVWFTAREPGAHRILCAEMCGVGHSRMWGAVVALSSGDFDRYLAGWEPDELSLAQLGIYLGDELAHDEPVLAPGQPSPDMAKEGERVAAERGCLRCHTVDGTPHIGPTWYGLFGKTETMQNGEKVRVDEAYITQSMMDPELRIVAGFPPVMPSYKGQISAPETAAIIEYMKTLRPGLTPDSLPTPAPPPAAPVTLTPTPAPFDTTRREESEQ